MQVRFGAFQVVLGIALMTGAFTRKFNIKGFDYLPQTLPYRFVFFMLGVISFCSGLYSLTHLHS
jgi:hypothetical protein